MPLQFNKVILRWDVESLLKQPPHLATWVVSPSLSSLNFNPIVTDDFYYHFLRSVVAEVVHVHEHFKRVVTFTGLGWHHSLSVDCRKVSTIGRSSNGGTQSLAVDG